MDKHLREVANYNPGDFKHATVIVKKSFHAQEAPIMRERSVTTMSNKSNRGAVNFRQSDHTKDHSVRKSKVTLNEDEDDEEDDLPVVEDMSPDKPIVHYESQTHNRYAGGMNQTGVDSNFGMTVIKDGAGLFEGSLMK